MRKPSGSQPGTGGVVVVLSGVSWPWEDTGVVLVGDEVPDGLPEPVVTVQLVGSGVWRGVRRVASLVRGLEVEYSGHAAVA